MDFFVYFFKEQENSEKKKIMPRINFFIELQFLASAGTISAYSFMVQKMFIITDSAKIFRVDN